MSNPPKHRVGHSLFVFGALLLLFSAAIFTPITTATTKAFGSSDIVDLTNKARVQLGGNELVTNTKLTSAAQAKAEDMVKLRYFAHNAPDGTMAWDYIKNADYAYEVAGENLAITNESAETVLERWMASPSHKDNIVNPDYQNIGVGMASYGNYEGHKNTTVIVALYGKPSGLQVVGASTNPAGGAAVLKPKYTNASPAVIGTIAVIVMLVGALLEFRHLRHLHHKIS